MRLLFGQEKSPLITPPESPRHRIWLRSKLSNSAFPATRAIRLWRLRRVKRATTARRAARRSGLRTQLARVCDLSRRQLGRNCRSRNAKTGATARHQRAGRQKARSLWPAGAAGVQWGRLKRLKPLRLDNQLRAGDECGPP